MPPMRVDEALRAARQKIDAIDARVLLQHASGLTHAQQQTHPEGRLTDEVVQAFMQLITRRAAGEPVAYLIGTREFYGRSFRVTPAVLIPRPETEHLIDIALQSVSHLAHPRILDLGTGSGIIAITLACMKPGAHLVAVDASIDALAIARDNAKRHQANVDFRQSDWYSALGDERFDLIVSNPPYIAANDTHLSQGDLRFEPHGALTDDSADGLASLRAIIAGAQAHLQPQGRLWLEHGFDQAAAVCALLAQAGFKHPGSQPDLAGHLRASGAQVA